jgi:hypothetical protein
MKVRESLRRKRLRDGLRQQGSAFGALLFGTSKLVP